MPKVVQPKQIVEFRHMGIYKITPKVEIMCSKEPFIIQWVGFDKIIDFNNKTQIVGQKVIVKYQFISNSKNHMEPLQGNTLNVPISLNNIAHVEPTELIIGNKYNVGERTLVLRGFINHDFYVSEDPYTNNYETYHNIPVDEKKQIFRIPINSI
jgi:hypothetical protein